jgi:hypothetical protein
MQPNIERSSIVVEQVDNFIQQLHNGDIALSLKAQNLKLKITKKGALGLKTEKDVGSLADLLGKAIAKYQLLIDISPETQATTAYELLDLIERARTHGVIISKNLTKKLDKCRQENSQLKEENDKLKEENIRLTQLNESLHETLDKLGARRRGLS